MIDAYMVLLSAILCVSICAAFRPRDQATQLMDVMQQILIRVTSVLETHEDKLTGLKEDVEQHKMLIAKIRRKIPPLSER